MHEFSLCQNIVSIVTTNAKNNLPKIKKIVIKVGDLASVDLESLCFWFPIATKNTLINNAILSVKHEQGKALCNQCDNKYSLNQLYQACPNCGSYDKQITAGQEFLVESIIYK